MQLLLFSGPWPPPIVPWQAAISGAPAADHHDVIEITTLPEPRRSRQMCCFSGEERFEILDMIPSPPVEVNWQEARWFAAEIVRQAVEDFCEPPQPLDPPPEVPERSIRQWRRMARSRARKVERFRHDAEEFLWSAWFESLCRGMGADPEYIRDGIYAKHDQELGDE